METSLVDNSNFNIDIRRCSSSSSSSDLILDNLQRKSKKQSLKYRRNSSYPTPNPLKTNLPDVPAAYKAGNLNFKTNFRRGYDLETSEECSNFTAFLTYFCYAILVIVGYVNDLIRPRVAVQKNRVGYPALYASFESFYTRNIYRRVRELWNVPISSVPGAKVTIKERITPDFGWSFIMTGNTNECINFGSYNYLGFAENLGVCAQESIQSVKKYGVSAASTRGEFGTSNLHTELEKLVARLVGTEDAITCAMGYATNTLNLPCIMGPGCLVLSDEKNHASIILGLRLSGAKVQQFEHNDPQDLEKHIRQRIIQGQPGSGAGWEKIFIVIEGVYSMEGTIANLPGILEIKKKYGAYLYIDEAHSIGAIGKSGRGVVDYWGIDPKEVDILMGTFTKSFGSAGGYIAGSKELIALLRKKSHAQCYGSAMTPAVTQQIITSTKIILGEDGSEDGVNRIATLAKNSRYFRRRLKQMGFIVYGSHDSPVIPVGIYVPTKVTYMIREMSKRGFATVGVGYPATKMTESRARFCMSSAHTKEMLDKALDSIYEVGSSIRVNNSSGPRPKGEIIYDSEY